MASKPLPTTCPSCLHTLKVVKLACADCATAVEGDFDLSLLAQLDADDQTLILNFLKSSGSLKELARLYGISYPTVRNRLDALIDKVKKLEPRPAKKQKG